MANADFQRHIQLLIEVAGQVDPSVQAAIQRTIDFMTLLGEHQEDILRQSRQVAQSLNPAVVQQYNQALSQVSGQYQAQVQAVTPLTQIVNALTQSQQQNTQTVQQQGQAYQQTGEGIRGFFRDVAAFASGSLLADAVRGVFSGVGDFLGTLKDTAVDAARYVGDVVNSLNISKTQIGILVGDAEKAGDAIEQARRTAIDVPFVDFEESLRTIRQLTAAGLDYNRWLTVVQNTAAVTTNEFGTMGQRMQAITRAIGEIAAGATGRGLNALRIMGINVHEAGIEFSRTGEAVGSTQSILEKLENYLNTKFGTALTGLNRQADAIKQNLLDLGRQLIESFFTPIFAPLVEDAARFFDLIKARAPEIRAFAEVLGEGLGSEIQGFLGILDQAAQQLVGGTNWEEAGARLILSFGDGILAGAEYVIQVVADIAAAIASFLVGMSPPPEGPLSEVDTGGANVVNAWADGMESALPKAVAAATRVASATSQALSSVQTYGPNLLDQFGGSQIGSLIGRALPAVNGVINQLRLAGVGGAEAYLEGFRVGFDISPIQKIMSAVDAALKYGVDTKQIGQTAVAGYTEGLRELLYRAALEVQEFGAVTQTTLDSVNANFGVMADNVSRILDLMGALSAISGQIADAQAAVISAQDAVRAAQAGVQAAEDIVKSYQAAVDVAQAEVDAVQKQIDAQQMRIREFEFETSDIPERFTRGRRRELDVVTLRLEQEKVLRGLAVEAAQARVKEAQAGVEAARQIVEQRQRELQAAQRIVQQLQAQKQQAQELLRLEEQRLDALQKSIAAQDQAVKAAKAAAGAKPGDERGFFEGIGAGSAGLSKSFEDLKAKTREWLKLIAPEQLSSIISRFEHLKNILRDLLGVQSEPETDITTGLVIPREETIGTQLRKSLIDIRENWYKIGDAAEDAWHRAVSAFLDFKKIVDDFFSGERTETDVSGLVIPKEGTGTKLRQIFDDVSKAIKGALDLAKEFNKVLQDIRDKFDNRSSDLGPAFGQPGMYKAGEEFRGGLNEKFPDLMKPIQEATGALKTFLGLLSQPMEGNAVDDLNRTFLPLPVNIHAGELAWNSFWENVALTTVTTLHAGELAWNTYWDNVATASAIALFNLTVLITTNWDKFTKFVKEKYDEWVAAGEKWLRDAIAQVQRWADVVEQEVRRAIEFAKAKIDEWRTAFDEFFTHIIEQVNTKLAEFSGIIAEKQAEIVANWNALWNAVTTSEPFVAFKEALDHILELLGKIADFRLPNLTGATQQAQQAANQASGGGNTAGSGFDNGNNDNTPPSNDQGGQTGQFATGGVVFRTAQYLLHKGEVVLNEGQQAAIMRGIQSAPVGQRMQPVTVQITQTFDGTPSLETRLQIQREMKSSAYEAVRTALKGGR